MGRVISLSGEVSVTVIPETGTLTFFVPDYLPDPIQLFVSVDDGPRQLQNGNRGGVDAMNWLQAGHFYRWDVTAGPDFTLFLSHFLDTRTTPPRQWDVEPTQATGAPGGSAAPSWFDQQMIAGVPNSLLAIGGGLAGVMLLTKKR